MGIPGSPCQTHQICLSRDLRRAYHGDGEAASCIQPEEFTAMSLRTVAILCRIVYICLLYAAINAGKNTRAVSDWHREPFATKSCTRMCTNSFLMVDFGSIRGSCQKPQNQKWIFLKQT